MMTQRSIVETVQAAVRKGPSNEAQTGTVDYNVSNVTVTDGEGNNSYSRSVENELDTETTHDHYSPWHDRTNDQLDRDQCEPFASRSSRIAAV